MPKENEYPLEILEHYRQKCSVCLKEITSREFIEEGGLCKDCHKEVQDIYSKGGTYEDVRKFWMKKREEYARGLEGKL